MRPAARALLLAAALSLSACATTAPGGRADPLEPLNRAVFAVNEALDDVVAEPAAKVYVAVVPEALRVTASNVFDNLRDLWTAANQLLQGKPREAMSDLGRFLINSTFGFAGFADIASDLGFERHREDFGQTLGRWGVPQGPYLVLPVFGPSTLRDGFGLYADMVADPVGAIDPIDARNAARGLRVVDTRASLLKAGRVIEGAALDKYSFVRDGYFQRRRNLVWDGDPPPDPQAPNGNREN
jgi:phospholipid-binding lipoprotein MlaA